MVDKQLKNNSRTDNVIVCESEDKLVGFEGFGFLQYLGLTLDTSSIGDSDSSQNVIVAIHSVSKAQPSTSTPIHIINSTNITVPRVKRKET